MRGTYISLIFKGYYFLYIKWLYTSTVLSGQTSDTFSVGYNVYSLHTVSTIPVCIKFPLSANKSEEEASSVFSAQQHLYYTLMDRDLPELSVAQVVKPNVATVHISKKDHYWQQTQKYCKGFTLFLAKWGLLLTPNLS